MDDLMMEHPICKEKPVFSLWQNQPSVIIGTSQVAEQEVNMEYCQEHGIKVVRRCTGGGAVYHDLGNVNFSLFVPIKDFEPSYALCYDIFSRIFKRLGLEIELSQTNDLLIDGKKFSGMASKKNAEVALLHGTLLFDVDMAHLAKALENKLGKFDKPKGVKSRHAEVTNLKPYLKEVGNSEDFFMLMKTTMAEEFELTEMQLSADFIEKVSELAKGKYSPL